MKVINIALILIIPFKENVPNILEARSEIYEMQICNYTQTYTLNRTFKVCPNQTLI